MVDENEFECKDEKVKEDEYLHCHQHVLKNCSTILTNFSIFPKFNKKVRKFGNFEKPKLLKLNHFITFIRKKDEMLVNFSFLA